MELSNNFNETKKEINFEFIDGIRCLSMMGIVLEHSTYIATYLTPGINLKTLVYMSIIQFSKAGTISFFILAGFLLGSKFTNYTAKEYFKRRLSSTIVPWIIWSFIFVLSMTLKFWVILHNEKDFNLLNTF